MRKLKCYGKCNEKYEKDKLKVFRGKNYCEKCYEKVVKDNDDRVVLYNMIKTYYGVTFPTGMHLRQIKNQLNLGYTYGDLIKAFNYTLKIKKMTQFNQTMGLGWITNNIEAALKFYKDEEKRAVNIFETYDENSNVETKVKVAKLDNTNKYKESKIISLEDIL